MFQSTPPTRRATTWLRSTAGGHCVSIHAPHTEGDVLRFVTNGPLSLSFNPRPPHGGRLPGGANTNLKKLFQSTPPTRRATPDNVGDQGDSQVSIHAPHTEGDTGERLGEATYQSFNPRPPHGGRLICTARRLAGGRQVSIHAPHTEGDQTAVCARARRSGFNPRPPHGGRRDRLAGHHCTVLFQSTPPTRRATSAAALVPRAELVSIHAPHTEGDGETAAILRANQSFNPRPPHGGRQDNIFIADRRTQCFNPRPPHGGRLRGRVAIDPSAVFQSTPPTRRATQSFADLQQRL